MKPKAATGPTLIVLASLILAACVPVPPPAPQVPAPATSGVAAPAPVSDWQLYTDADAGFSIQIPATWSSEPLPDQNNGAIHGTAFTGPQGGVEVYWGIGFGGACPQGTEPVQLAQGEVQACHGTTPEGTEIWSQIGYEVSGGNSFSVRAYTSDTQPSSHDLVLQVLTTLAFMPPAQPQTGAAIANPASENCVKQGGTVSIVERGDGGQYGICTFEDNRQCEEWALMRGDCPVGGVKVTGYVTPAATYCAITGGAYAVTGKSGAEDEQGTCTFKDGSQCDVWEYYNGGCAPGAAPAPSAKPTPAPAVSIQPLTMEVCDGQAQAMAHFLDVVEVTQSEEPISDFVTGTSGTGCQATVTGTGEQFESPDAVVKTLGSMLEDQGYTQDPMLAAGGPNAIDLGYRKGDEICWVGAGWRPDESANCPEDQAVSACEVTPEQQNYTITLNCGVELTEEEELMYGLANPASVNCEEKGGTVSIEQRDDGTQFGVCYFEDNLQCDTWALLWDKCPVGGVKVTGYVTQAARYCAISGNEYTVTGNSGTADEQGTCTQPDGTECDASYYYYHGTCALTDTEVITYVPPPPAGQPQEGKCWTSSLAVWREDAWRCTVGNAIYDPCFSSGGDVICGGNPVAASETFLLTLTEPLPEPDVPEDTTGHAWVVELADGAVCEYATGATGGVGDERINYFCPSPDPDQTVVILGDLGEGSLWLAKRAVLTGGPPEPAVLESAEVPIRTVWR